MPLASNALQDMAYVLERACRRALKRQARVNWAEVFKKAPKKVVKK